MHLARSLKMLGTDSYFPTVLSLVCISECTVITYDLDFVIIGVVELYRQFSAEPFTQEDEEVGQKSIKKNQFFVEFSDVSISDSYTKFYLEGLQIV